MKPETSFLSLSLPLSVSTSLYVRVCDSLTVKKMPVCAFVHLALKHKPAVDETENLKMCKTRIIGFNSDY